MKKTTKIILAISGLAPLVAALLYDQLYWIKTPYSPALRESMWYSISSEIFFVFALFIWAIFLIISLKLSKADSKDVTHVCLASTVIQLVPLILLFIFTFIVELIMIADGLESYLSEIFSVFGIGAFLIVLTNAAIFVVAYGLSKVRFVPRSK